MILRQNRFLRTLARHPAISVVLLIALLSGGVWAAYQQGKRTGLERIERILDARVNAHERYLLEALGKYWLVPEVIAVSPAVRQMLAQPNAANVEAVNHLLEETTTSIQADRISVMSVDGTVQAANLGRDKLSIIGENFAYRPYFKQSLAGQTGHFIGMGMASPAVGYFISRPVLIDGKVGGVVVIRVSLSLQVFQSVVKQYWENNSEIALITDEHGVIFMGPIDRWVFRTIEPLSTTVRDEILASHQYGEQSLLPMAMTAGQPLTKEVRFVQFADLPNHTFVQKLYSIGEIGDKIYLYVNATQYWEPVIVYTVLAFLTAIAGLLLAIAAFQRWSYRTKLVEAAIHDPLTGLYTRLYMNEWIQTAMREHQRDPEAGFALVIFDLDHFKKVNDTHGHLIGDAVLKGVGQIIVNSIRAGDLAVRFGGEELAVFMHYAEKSEVVALAERIRTKLESSGVQTAAGRIAVTASAGLAFHQDGELSDMLFARADEKLYRAKEAGRNRLCY